MEKNNDEFVVLTSETIAEQKSHDKKVEKILKIIAVAVTAMGLLVSGLVMFQGNKHNMLSVQPHLDFWYRSVPKTNNNKNDIIEFSLNNTGLGPAIITDYKIFAFNGLIYEEIIGANLTDLQLEDEIISKTEGINGVRFFNDSYAEVGEGVEASSGDETQMLLNVSKELFANYRAIDEILVLAICYKSLHGKQAYVDSRDKPIENRLIKKCSIIDDKLPPISKSL